VDQELLSKMQSRRAVPADIPAATNCRDKARVSSNVSEELLTKMQSRRAVPVAQAASAQQDNANSSSRVSKELLTKMQSRRAVPIVPPAAVGQQGKTESSIRIDQELMYKMHHMKAREIYPPVSSTAFKNPSKRFDAENHAKKLSSSTSRMEAKEDMPQDIDTIRIEVMHLVEDTKPGTSENMLKAYKERE